MSQEGKPDFYTQKGYQMRSQHALTGAMEDYLEMICRQAEADGCARIGLLAEGLNVRPSSASKMVYQLRALGLVAFEKYGLIQPTEKGCELPQSNDRKQYQPLGTANGLMTFRSGDHTSPKNAPATTFQSPLSHARAGCRP